MGYEPVRPLVLSLYVEASAEHAALFQHPVSFFVRRFFIGESVESVQRQNDIKAAVVIAERTDVSLTELNISQTKPLSLFLCLSHHIGGVVNAGDIGALQCFVQRHCENSRSDRHFKKPARKVLGNP